MTNSRVDMLCELDSQDIKPFENERPNSDFLGILSSVLGKKIGSAAGRKNADDRDGAEK
jgi:hypothetical protein